MDSTVAAILAGHVFAGIGGMIVKGNLFEPRCLRRIWTCLWQKVVACAAAAPAEPGCPAEPARTVTRLCDWYLHAGDADCDQLQQ